MGEGSNRFFESLACPCRSDPKSVHILRGLAPPRSCMNRYSIPGMNREMCLHFADFLRYVPVLAQEFDKDVYGRMLGDTGSTTRRSTEPIWSVRCYFPRHEQIANTLQRTRNAMDERTRKPCAVRAEVKNGLPRVWIRPEGQEDLRILVLISPRLYMCFFSTRREQRQRKPRVNHLNKPRYPDVITVC